MLTVPIPDAQFATDGGQAHKSLENGGCTSHENFQPLAELILVTTGLGDEYPVPAGRMAPAMAPAESLTPELYAALFQEEETL